MILDMKSNENDTFKTSALNYQIAFEIHMNQIMLNKSIRVALMRKPMKWKQNSKIKGCK